MRGAGELGERQGIHVIERCGDQQAVPHHILPLQAGAYDPEMTLMRQDHALGLAGRAGRVQEHGRLCRGRLHCSERTMVKKASEALWPGVTESDDRQISRAVEPSL